LIENAIIHGVKNMDEDGEIIITSVLQDDRILITIEDNGYKRVDYKAIALVLNDESPNPVSGYGIRNINQRVHLHFGPDYGISYGPRAGGGTVVTVTLPKSETME
jgi:two-component system sensor histidine kinase YesM